jgi:hypothetical protein
MLGGRQPQRSLFEAQAWPQRVPADSFYARLGAVMEQLFGDDDPFGRLRAGLGGDVLSRQWPAEYSPVADERRPAAAVLR